MINKRAQAQAKSFMSEVSENRWQSDPIKNSDVTDKLLGLKFDQVFLVYKFIETPIEMLAEGMGRLPKETAKKYFRTIALQLHPDKNAHPSAKEAFQKMQQALELSSRQQPSMPMNG
jgi:hypothetical protein